MKNLIKLFFFFVLLTCSCHAQEKIKFTDRLYSGDMSSRYHYVQGRVSWMPTHTMYGIQYKRLKSDNEAGIYTFFTGQTLSLNYGKLNNQDLINSNLEAHFRSFPVTAGLIRIGAGIDYTTNFDQIQFLSVYPSIGLDMGGVEIIYSYLINRYSSAEISDHRITLAVGLWVKTKEL